MNLEKSFESEEQNSDENKNESKKFSKLAEDRNSNLTDATGSHNNQRNASLKKSLNTNDSFELSGIESLRISSSVLKSQVVETREEYEARMQLIDQCALNIVSECIANVLNSSLNETLVECESVGNLLTFNPSEKDEILVSNL